MVKALGSVLGTAKRFFNFKKKYTGLECWICRMYNIAPRNLFCSYMHACVCLHVHMHTCAGTCCKMSLFLCLVDKKPVNFYVCKSKVWKVMKPNPSQGIKEKVDMWPGEAGGGQEWQIEGAVPFLMPPRTHPHLGLLKHPFLVSPTG